MSTLPASRWTVGIVIPAKDEEAGVERCVASVLTACDASRRCDDAWVVVVADACRDGTAARARARLGNRGEVIECAARSPGTARRLGVAAALRHFEDRASSRVWLANTDADTRVPPGWLDTHLQYADGDAEAVAGIVQLDPLGLQANLRDLYERIYPLGADGTHAHVHGANFGVRADAYLDAGGWSDLSVAEDHCLWGRLRQCGSHLCSPAGSVVHTSARLRGRATGGFADTLRRQLSARE